MTAPAMITAAAGFQEESQGGRGGGGGGNSPQGGGEFDGTMFNAPRRHGLAGADIQSEKLCKAMTKQNKLFL